LKRISESNGAYDPLQYPCIYVHGGYGFSQDLYHNGHKITVKQFYAYRLMERNHQNTLLHLSGKLFQQYIVDQYAKVEGDRLLWFRRNQSKLRIDSYNNVEDAVAGVNAQGVPINATNIGRRIILPSSHVGGPRFMNSLYQDSMAVVRYIGRPDLFTTFTTNPMWIEIQRELKPGQTASDRPDLVSRVFNLKLQKLLADLRALPGFAGRIFSIEFQKRGLPHAHILIILKSTHKLRTPAMIDALVTARLSKDPIIRAKQIKHMTHGPCGVLNPNAPYTLNPPARFIQ
jgi:hypothetical protein